jgi:hypothetical protein
MQPINFHNRHKEILVQQFVRHSSKTRKVILGVCFCAMCWHGSIYPKEAASFFHNRFGFGLKCRKRLEGDKIVSSSF